MNVDDQLELLNKFREPDYVSLFDFLRNNFDVNPGYRGKEYWSQGLIHNGYFPSPDAELYAAMINFFRPRNIIEVGSGYSTLIARKTVDHIGFRNKIHVIDPEPRINIENYVDHVEYKRVEQSSIADYKFCENDFLFIDSSHVCRSSGDLPFLFGEILPALPANVFVQIHDIFIPYDYPDNYIERFYTEEYLLHAFLSHNRKFDVVLSAHFLSREVSSQKLGVGWITLHFQVDDKLEYAVG